MKKFLLAGLLYLGSTAAMAADSGLYFDISLGQSSIKDVDRAFFDDVFQGLTFASQFDDKGSAWSAAVGYKPLPYVAAELAYVDLGTVQYRANFSSGELYKAKLQARGPAIAAIGIFPIGSKFEVSGRVGWFFANGSIEEYATDFSTYTATGYGETDSRGLFFGGGAAFNATERFAIRVGWQRYKNVGNYENIESDVDVLSLGFTFSQ